MKYVREAFEMVKKRDINIWSFFDDWYSMEQSVDNYVQCTRILQIAKNWKISNTEDVEARDNDARAMVIRMLEIHEQKPKPHRALVFDDKDKYNNDKAIFYVLLIFDSLVFQLMALHCRLCDGRLKMCY